MKSDTESRLQQYNYLFHIYHCLGLGELGPGKAKSSFPGSIADQRVLLADPFILEKKETANRV